jgi:hypothetical protein
MTEAQQCKASLGKHCDINLKKLNKNKMKDLFEHKDGGHVF